MQDGDGKSREYVHEAEVDGEPGEKGEDAFATELFEYVRAELTWPIHMPFLAIALRDLPQVRHSSPKSRCLQRCSMI